MEFKEEFYDLESLRTEILETMLPEHKTVEEQNAFRSGFYSYEKLEARLKEYRPLLWLRYFWLNSKEHTEILSRVESTIKEIKSENLSLTYEIRRLHSILLDAGLVNAKKNRDGHS